MKLLTLIATAVLVLSGCGSSELSPEEKRNNYDACIGKYYAEYGSNQPEELAKQSCYGYLE